MRNLFMLWTILATFFSFTSFAQTIDCGTDYFLEKEYAKDPSLRSIVEKNWDINTVPATQAEGAIKYIPVVFHIFHDDAIGNISYAQIQSAIDMLNEDFRRLNADTTSTSSIFLPHAVDSEIEFRLAKIDPQGNCTNGVVRINDASAAYDAENFVKSRSHWPANKYFNIWVVKTIESSGVNGTILGYAQFPRTQASSWDTYGVVIRSDRVGRTGTANSGDRTLTHEVGHCLNLLHTFQSGCGTDCDGSGDRCCDTPPVSQSTQGCNKNLNTCSNDAVGSSPYTTDVNNQIENYMSYDDCQNMFSGDQKVRMINSISFYDTLAMLTSDANLNNVGAWLGEPAICKADFNVKSQVVCIGEPIEFLDASFFNPDSYSWNFPGGQPSVANVKNPIIIYNTPGTYEVSLTIADTNNTSVTEVKTGFITVISSQGKTMPAQESFESFNTLVVDEWFGDSISTNFGWFRSVNGGSTGISSIKAMAYGKKGKINISSPAYDTRNMDSINVSFKYAYAPRPNEPNNYLRVYVSTDCGQSWSMKFITGGPIFGTRAELSSSYTFPAAADWAKKKFALPSFMVTDNLRLKFVLYADNGNNLFIDDINISGINKDSTILNYPENGANDISTSVKLDWYGTSLANYYTVAIDTDTSFTSSNLQTHQVLYISSSSSGSDSEFLTSNLIDGVTYYWKVRSTLNGTSNAWSETWSFTPDSAVVGVEDVMNYQTVMNVYPNPASEVINVKVEINRSTKISIELFDITGHFIASIYSGQVESGIQYYSLDRNGLSNGVYFIRTETDAGVVTKRLILN